MDGQGKYTVDYCRFEQIKRQCAFQYKNEHGATCMTRYILDGDDKLVLLLNKTEGTFKEIVSRDGNFTNFPGIVYDEGWQKRFVYSSVREHIVYGAYIVRQNDGTYVFLWIVQPDKFDPGDEWGFGMEEQPQIVLYSLLDAEGNFTKPFELYSISCDCYYQDHEEIKVVFLDFDGVLNSKTYLSQHPQTGMVIDPDCLKRLQKLIFATDAKIVLSTSWRQHWNIFNLFCDKIGKEIDNMFAAGGLYIYDKTPEINRDRHAEITDWLSHHPNATRYVVLDDEPFEEGILKNHFVLTSRLRKGLDEDDVERAIQILNG